jgi:hypothetical protein
MNLKTALLLAVADKILPTPVPGCHGTGLTLRQASSFGDRRPAAENP